MREVSEETSTNPKPPTPHEDSPARRLLLEAHRLYGMQRREALQLARQALDKATSSDDTTTAVSALQILLAADQVEGLAETAHRLGNEALAKARNAGLYEEQNNALNLLAMVASVRGEYDLAAHHLTEMLELADRLEAKSRKHEETVRVICNNLASLLWQKGDLLRALEYQQRSLAVGRDLGDQQGVCSAFLNLGLIYRDLGDWDKALESFFRVLVEAEKACDEAGMSKYYNNIGEVYLMRGKLDRAEFYLQQALDIVQASSSTSLYAEVLGNLGETAFASGDYGRAQGYYERGHEVCRDSGYRAEQAETLRRWAELDLSHENLGPARSKLDEALKLCTQTGSRREEGNIWRVTGELLMMSGDTDGAREAIGRGIALLRSLGRNYDLARALLALGRLMSQTRDDGEAPLTEAATIFRNLGVTHLLERTETLLSGSGAASREVDIIQRLTELACGAVTVDEFCTGALDVLVSDLPADGAAVLLKDGGEFKKGNTAPDETVGNTTNIALVTGSRRIGTLVLGGDIDLPRAQTVAGLMALGLANASSATDAEAVTPPTTDARYPTIVGSETSLRSILETVEQVARTTATVLVLGESGTGKELIARTLHDMSPRSDAPFVAINCAAIPETLLESELFGIEKGTATGVAERKGKFESADGGTLFLDEVGDMSLALQAKMLRVLEDRRFERVGGRAPIEADVRIVAATNRSLPEDIRTGRFRPDLFYRLNVISVTLPPLRERREDIPALVHHFVWRFSREYSKSCGGVTDSCLAQLLSYDWPGNVRELQNTIERGLILARGEFITLDDIPAGIRNRSSASTIPAWQKVRREAQAAAAEEVEKKAVITALEECSWVIKHSADSLGISRAQLYRIMKRHGITKPLGRQR